MRVLMCAGFYDIGGSSTVIEKLGNKLTEKGHEVTIAALLFKRFPLQGGYEVARIPVVDILKLRRFLEDFDIIHNHHPITNFLALVSRKPFVYHYHGAPNFGTEYAFRISMLSSIKLTKRAFDAVIAVSESAAAELKRHFDPDDVHIVYNGVDTHLFKPGLKPKFRKGEPQFLFVGNLHPHKNLEELIFAMKALVKDCPKACLQIVGDGFMYEHLKNHVAEMGLGNHVELVGRVDGFELPHYYASCDVYVTASRWELFGLPLLESMACGKPVVASSIPSHIEILTKSKAGTIYKVGNIDDLSQKMIHTFKERAKYSSNGIIFANKFDWSNVAENVLNIYAKINGSQFDR